MTKFLNVTTIIKTNQTNILIKEIKIHESDNRY